MRLILVVVAVSLAGCSLFSDVDPPVGPEPETYEAYLAQRAALVRDLDRGIGEARATTSDACRVVAVGQKACGGPAEYRVFSAATADATAIEALADAITRLDAEANTRFGLVSDCMLVGPPSPALVEGRCRAADRP